MKVVAFLFCLLLSQSVVVAQNFDLYNNYFANPYVINPAEAATDYAMAHADYRKQWLGFNGAPAISTFTYTSRFNNSRSGFGAKLASAANGLMTTNEVLLTYAYGIGLNDHQNLTFALSAGGTSNQLDLSKIDTSDPAVQKFMSNNTNPSANFGMLFKCASGINMGITLPELFKKNYQGSESGNAIHSLPTDEIIFNAYYSRTLKGGMVNKRRNGFVRKMKADSRKAPLEFFFLYRYQKNLQGQAEGLVKLNVSERVAVAAGYRQWLGPMTGVHFDFEKLIVSYSYEPFNRLGEFTTSSHEIQLGLRLGKKKEELKKKTPLLRSTLKGKTKEEHIARFHQENEDDLLQTEKPVIKKHYVVVKSFKDFEQADEFKQKLIDQKFNGNVIYSEHDKLYHVYIFESSKAGDAHNEARNVRNFTKLKQAKVISIEEKK